MPFSVPPQSLVSTAATTPAAGQAGARQRPLRAIHAGPPTAKSSPLFLRRRHVAPPKSSPPSAPSRLLATLDPPRSVPPPPPPPPPSPSRATLSRPAASPQTKPARCPRRLPTSHYTTEVGDWRSSLNSASNPDAILALLSSVGLSRADIAAIVSADPLLLRAYVNKVGPRLLALRDQVGLSTPQIARFLPFASRSLRHCDVAPKVEFFISFFGSFDWVLAVAKGNGRLFNASLEKNIKPNIALFRQFGVPDIAKVCLRSPWVLAFKPERVKEFLLRAEELGVPPTSGMFRHAVAVTSGLSKENFAAKLEFLKNTLGCSEHEVSIAVSKKPQVLGLSEDNIGCKIEFLINEAAMEPQYIVQRPILLTLSLEKRLVPRHYVMKVLQEKGLLNSTTNFFRLVKLGEETFKLKLIDAHKDSVLGLADAYAAARAGILPSRV